MLQPLGAILDGDHVAALRPHGGTEEEGCGFGMTAPFSAGLCAVLVGYAGWSHRRLQFFAAPAPASPGAVLTHATQRWLIQ